MCGVGGERNLRDPRMVSQSECSVLLERPTGKGQGAGMGEGVSGGSAAGAQGPERPRRSSGPEFSCLSGPGIN